jgi:hypothetical protein
MAIGLASPNRTWARILPNSRPGNQASSTAATSSRKHRDRRIGVDDDHGMQFPAATAQTSSSCRPRRCRRPTSRPSISTARPRHDYDRRVRVPRRVDRPRGLSPSVRCGACTPRRISPGRPSGGSSAAGDAPCGAAAGRSRPRSGCTRGPGDARGKSHPPRRNGRGRCWPGRWSTGTRATWRKQSAGRGSALAIDAGLGAARLVRPARSSA